MPMPCSDHDVLLKTTAQHGRRETAVLCRGLEKNGMMGAWHGRGMASVNQTRPHCVNQMGKTHSKLLAARHAMCESAFRILAVTSRLDAMLNHFLGPVFRRQPTDIVRQMLPKVQCHTMCHYALQ